MSRNRLILVISVSLFALSTGWTIVKPSSCDWVSPLSTPRRHRLAPGKPTYFQVDDTALEFEDSDTPSSHNFDKIKSMACFLWIRSAVALLHSGQSALKSSSDVDITTEPKQHEITTESVLENKESGHTENLPEIKEGTLLEDDLTSNRNDTSSLATEDTSKREVTNLDVNERTVGKEAITGSSERSSMMHRKEGDRVIALQDKFLDPLPEAISLDFGRPLEIIEHGVPPLRQTSNPAASSK